MTVVDIGAQASPAFGAGCPVVCVPLYGAHELFARCLRSLVLHTPPGVPILIADDATPDAASRELAEGQQRAIYWSRAESNQGFVENVNRAFALTAPADAVIVNSDVEVAEGWLDGLRDAAHSAAKVATATPFTNHGTIVSVPVRNSPQPELPAGATLDSVAARLRATAERTRPQLPTAIGHCMYMRREALDAVGDFDTAFSPGYGEEVDLSQRCLAAGFTHVVADDVFVLHHGNGSFGAASDERRQLQQAHEEIIAGRYPDYHDAVREAASSTDSPLARATAIAAAAVTPPAPHRSLLDRLLRR